MPTEEAGQRSGAGSANLRSPLSNCVQIAYVTTDLERAKTLFADIYCVGQWLDLGSPEKGGSVIETRQGARIVLRGAIAYVGAMQFELLQPVEDEDKIYCSFLPADGSFAIRFHHLGFNHASKAEVHDLESAMSMRHLIPMAIDSETVPVFYADERQRIGHYLEHVCLPDSFDRLIPRN
jgi:hypothetical protein